jgi:hypothetical protein
MQTPVCDFYPGQSGLLQINKLMQKNPSPYRAQSRSTCPAKARQGEPANSQIFRQVRDLAGASKRRNCDNRLKKLKKSTLQSNSFKIKTGFFVPMGRFAKKPILLIRS